MSIKVSPRQPITRDLWLSNQITECLMNFDRQPLDEIEIKHSRSTTKFCDHFLIEQIQDGSECVNWEGDFSRVHGIGSGMKSGVIQITGDVGSALGQFISGGEIQVNGSTSHYLGRGMSGGRIHVSGNSGDHAGGPDQNSIRGMTGGEIFIQGNAGNYLGERMRRGTIVVLGTTADYPGFEMLAGTIIMNQGFGNGPGIGMKRGTLISHQAEQMETCLHLEYAIQYEPTILKVMYHWLSEHGFPQFRKLMQSEFHRYCGDMASGGRGEVFFPV